MTAQHQIHWVTSFKIDSPYTLQIVFADQSTQKIDFRPVLEGEMYSPLQDEAVFNGVRLDAETGTLVWPNGADFDPAMLHDWATYGPLLAAKAQQWAAVKAAA